MPSGMGFEDVLMRIICMSLLLAPAAAWAQDSWSQPLPGVDLLSRTASGPRQIRVAHIDLCADGVGTRTTMEDERQRTPSSWGQLVGADLVINGDFFSYTDYRPAGGMAIGNGQYWSTDNGKGFVAFGDDRAELPPAAVVYNPADWMRDAVGGYALVSDGVRHSPLEPSHCSERHPRSAVGLSWDRQTLILATVDGRSSASIGMTCAELADLMIEQGAHQALNLDGGGSTAMWMSSLGVVNRPSDGSQRVVSNHIGVFATGSGAPGSCEHWADEATIGAARLDGESTDIDGDGLADICARGYSALYCHTSTGVGIDTTPWVIDGLGDPAGFDAPEHYGTLRFGDLDADGLADVCARGADGLTCWNSTGTGFGGAMPTGLYPDAGGWSAYGYGETLQRPDFNGDGRADVCARGGDGLLCYASHGAGFDGPVAAGNFDDASGWRSPEHYQTLRFGDLDGDGRDDVCARGNAGMYCYLSDGAGFPTRFGDEPLWSDDAGWDQARHFGTIRLVDLDGDGRDDLCGRGPDGIECALSNGSGFDPVFAGPELSNATGWGDHANASTVRFGDLDGDGDQDLCARANVGVWCWLYDNGAFATQLDGPAWSEDTGWDHHRYYSTLTLADVTGDRRADLCARGPDGVQCAPSNGGGFDALIDGPGWSDANGWSAERYWSTLRIGSAPPAPPADTGDTGASQDTDLPGEPDAPTDTGRDTGLAGDPLEQGSLKGCSCRFAGSPWAGLWLVPLLGLRRRR